jgi:hypothetical protein
MGKLSSAFEKADTSAAYPNVAIGDFLVKELSAAYPSARLETVSKFVLSAIASSFIVNKRLLSIFILSLATGFRNANSCTR